MKAGKHRATPQSMDAFVTETQDTNRYVSTSLSDSIMSLLQRASLAAFLAGTALWQVYVMHQWMHMHKQCFRAPRVVVSHRLTINADPVSGEILRVSRPP